MVGLHKFTGKEKREQRRRMASSKGRNHVARDLATQKYRQRIIPDKKRLDNDDGTFYLDERYYEDADE